MDLDYNTKDLIYLGFVLKIKFRLHPEKFKYNISKYDLCT